MDTFRYIFSSAEDSLDAIAKRFRTTEEQIRVLSLADGQKWADHWLVTINHLNILHDGDVLVVPVPDDFPSLPPGAEWRTFLTPAGATVRSVMQTLKTPVPDVGRIIDDADSVASLIWDYYRNAPVRCASVQAGLPPGQTSDSCTLREGSPLLVPVFVPQEQVVCVAPSPVGAPQTGATIDVKPDDRFSRLARLLQDVECALDDIDAVRARIAAGQLTAENICTNFIKLKESMEETAKDFASANEFYASSWSARNGGAPLNYDAAHEGESAREAAIKAIEPLIDAAVENLRGQPVWRKEYPSAESDLKVATTTLKQTIMSEELMQLVVDLVPTVFALPMSVRAARLLRKRKTGVSCLTYICRLAARASLALANSPTKADGDRLKQFVGQTKLAGNECSDLIEYACACTRGFDKTKMRPTNPAPFSCLGVVSTLHMANALERIWGSPTSSSAEQVSPAILAAKLAFRDLEPLLAGFEGEGEAKAEDERLEAIKKKLEIYSEIKEAGESVHDALSLSEPLKESVATELLGAILSPFDKEDGAFRELIPKSARSFYYAFQVLYDTTEKIAKTKESSQKTSDAAIFETYKSSMEFKKAILEGAKALDFIEAEGAELAESAVDFLGRATFLLTIVVEACEAREAEERGDAKAAAGHVALAESALCFLLGGATAGATSGVFIAVGTVLLLGGVVATKGDIVVAVYKGDAVTSYQRILTSPAAAWASAFGFESEWAAFKAAFEPADFRVGDMASKRLAVAVSAGAAP